MPNGRPGDHPLTDILVHGKEVYGKHTDDLIKTISELCTPQELSDWWNNEIDPHLDAEALLGAVSNKYMEMLARKKQDM